MSTLNISNVLVLGAAQAARPRLLAHSPCWGQWTVPKKETTRNPRVFAVHTKSNEIRATLCVKNITPWEIYATKNLLETPAYVDNETCSLEKSGPKHERCCNERVSVTRVVETFSENKYKLSIVLYPLKQSWKLRGWPPRDMQWTAGPKNHVGLNLRSASLVTIYIRKLLHEVHSPHKWIGVWTVW